MNQATATKPTPPNFPPDSPPDFPSDSSPAAPSSVDVTEAGCVEPAAPPSVFRSYVTLAKPRIMLMVIVTVWVGYMFGIGAGGLDWLVMSATLFGAGLSCMGASALNQVYERDTDAKMKRTKDRPMPTGRIGVGAGWAFGVALSVAGVLLLGLMTTWLAALVSAVTVVSYAVVYTPMKRTTHMATVVGALPGALPPVLGYAAATGGAGTIGVEAVLLFAIMFVWQLPHTLAIYWLYRDDFAKAGFPMLPVIDPTGSYTFRQILIGSLLLLPLGLTPTLFGISGLVYFVTAFICGMLMLGASLSLAAEPTRGRARGLFFASLVYLPVVLVVMLVDRL
jgi:heme o synthase